MIQGLGGHPGIARALVMVGVGGAFTPLAAGGVIASRVGRFGFERNDRGWPIPVAAVGSGSIQAPPAAAGGTSRWSPLAFAGPGCGDRWWRSGKKLTEKLLCRVGCFTDGAMTCGKAFVNAALRTFRTP